MIKTLKRQVSQLEELIISCRSGLLDARSNRLTDAAKFYEDHLNFALDKWLSVRDKVATGEMETWFK